MESNESNKKQLKHPYDLSLKELFSDLPYNFVKLLTGLEPKSIVATEYQDFQLKPDFVVELVNGDILHVEFQRDNDPTMVYRMLSYYSLIKNRFKDKRIIQAVLYIGDKTMSMPNKLIEDGIHYEFTIVDTKNIPCETLVNSDNPADLILASICNIKDPKAYFQKVSDKLNTLSEKERIRYLKLLTNLLRGRKLLSKALEVENMRIWLTEEEILQDPFYKIGEEKGIEKGIEKGKLEGAKELLLLSINIRFGAVPEDILAKINSIDNLQYIEDITKAILQSNSLDEIKDIVFNY
ncbi:MAG: Rpn family recombination-promoting nuclease/putative transposase [Hydrogenobaculum sp.]